MYDTYDVAFQERNHERKIMSVLIMNIMKGSVHDEYMCIEFFEANVWIVYVIIDV